MRGNELLEKMELIAPAYVEAAEAKPKKKRNIWIKWGVMAACLCLVVASVVTFIPKNGNRTVLKWSENFKPESYFKYNHGINDAASVKSIADSEIRYAASRDFSDFRSQMEADEVIPVLPEHPLFTCEARYNEDGSIYCVIFSWHQRGETYSDLSVTVGYQEVPQIRDCIFVEIDKHGNIVPPSVTVTEREGIRIVAEGNEHSNKTMTFQNEAAWYQIAGPWGDGYEAMVQLLDWVWVHPIDFDRFTMEKGVEFTDSSLEEFPGAFQNCIPDFETLGYFLGEHYLQLKDGTPCRFEGHYYTGIDPAKVEDGSYLSEDGWTEIHWCIDTEPDYYELQDCLGDISELSEQKIADLLADQSHFSFRVDDCYIRVYCKDAHEAWSAVASLVKRP